ncbi:MAG: thymidine phosphorylase [Methylotenera sp.]|nr:thymidine phosphorylase [Oligoflexia bacterium]
MVLNPAFIIQKKRDGEALKEAEIRFFIQGISTNEIPDYQATAFLMAVYFQGMTLDETVALTRAMLESGERYDLSHIPGFKVDKHSTGGVGDKVSLILAPLAAACGLKVPMMAGRGLGHSGGTLDKLESITGYDVRISKTRFAEIITKVGCSIIGQSDKIAPADRKLYSLRDVTATVECIPLIVASILSKKLAEGTQALVMDIKVGNGAFMKSKEEARKLSRTLIQVAKKLGLPCRAILTNMDQPLGNTAGNAIEVIESIELLRNERPAADLKEITIQLCAHMLELGKVVKNLSEGRKLAHARLADGSAWQIFQDMVKAQGGSLEQILDTKKLPHTSRSLVWKATKRGYITRMDTEVLGKILVELGGGRKKASDSVDPRVGFYFHKKLGARVQSGDPVATVYVAEKMPTELLKELEALFQEAVEIRGERKSVPKLISEVLT